MNFFEAQDFFKKMYPDKQINYEFDDQCHRLHEISYTNGLPHPIHHIECNKVKVTVEGLPSQYVPIQPHRYTVSWSDLKNYINTKDDVFLNEQIINQLKDLKQNNEASFDQSLNELSQITNLEKEALLEKVSNA